MTSDHLATASTRIAAPPETVWKALTDPAIIAEWMLGARVTSDWQVGSHITWAGSYEGEAFEDKGTILNLQPHVLLRTTHFSPMGGRQDIPENYHTVTWRLSAAGDGTILTLEQDNNPTEESAEHSSKNWQGMLDGLRKTVEARR